MVKWLKLTLIIVLLTLSVNCNSIPSYTSQDEAKLPLAPTLARKIVDLQLAVGRFEWWTTQDNNWHKTGHGTAFCIEKNDEGALWITAAHVAESLQVKLLKKMNPHLNFQSFLNYYDGDTSVMYDIKNVVISPNSDIACFTTDFKPLAKLDLCKNTSILRNDRVKKSVLMGCGYPNDIYPSLVTLGLYKEHKGGGLWHKCGGWYGNSGGPIVDIETMEVVALYTKFYPWPPSMSNSHWGQSAEQIREFLATIK
jgi:hypothetical protein